MLCSILYRPGYAKRIGIISTLIIVGAVAVCASAFVGFFIDWQRLRDSRVTLDKVICERTQLFRQSDDIGKALATSSATGDGGLEPLAVRISDWAKSHNVQLQSLTPQGDAKVSDIKLDKALVGRWAVRNIQIKGQGDLRQVVTLFDQMRSPLLMPVQLNSFGLTSTDDGKSGNVAFRFALTVYENTRRAD